MTYNEEDHPRDEKGRWTDAGGSKEETENENSNDELVLRGRIEKTDKKSPAEILYGKSGNTKTKEKEESIYRNVLLDTLGKFATPAAILFSKTKDLEKMVKENGLTNKVKQKIAEVGLDFGYKFGGFNYAKNNYGVDTVGMIDLVHEQKMNSDYTKNAIELKNFDDPRVASDKEYLVKKLNEQFKDYTRTFNIEEVRGHFFKNSSEPSIRMSQDKDFRKLIKDKKEAILNNKDVSGNFPRYHNGKESNFHYAIGHYDLRNSYIDKEGNLHTKVYDTYDFNKENKTPLNQAGRTKMLEGKLKPYYTIHDIIIPKGELDKIWNE